MSFVDINPRSSMGCLFYLVCVFIRHNSSQLAYPIYGQIWDIATKRILSTFQGHEKSLLSLEFSSDARLILSGSLDNTVRIWDMETGQHKSLSITAPSDVRFIVTYHCLWHADTLHCAYAG
jgi:WD40 repeat protein